MGVSFVKPFKKEDHFLLKYAIMGISKSCILDVTVAILHTSMKPLDDIFTPHDVSGVIVLTSSVCPSLCLLPLSWPNGQTYEYWHGGQVEGYRGQVNGSRS